MKLLLAIILVLSGGGFNSVVSQFMFASHADVKNFLQQFSNAEDLNAVNIKLINSMISVSGEQFARATAYINQYNSANLNLTLVAGKVQASFMGVIDLSPLQKFFADIQSTLNDNVQQLTVKFSPANVQSYIMGYFQTFLTNLLINNGTAADIFDMNMAYYGKILSPNATVCYNRYNSLYSDIYSRVADNFTRAVENEVASTVNRLETLRTEIETLVTDLVKSFEQIIDDKAFLSIGTFVREKKLLKSIVQCSYERNFHYRLHRTLSPLEATSQTGLLNSAL